MFLFMSVSCCFGYQSFMVYFEVQVCAASNIVFCLFFVVVLSWVVGSRLCQFSGSFVVPYEF